MPAPRSRVATWAELDAIIAAADELKLPSIGTAALMSMLQGQRQTDVIEARGEDFVVVSVPNGVNVQDVWAWDIDRSKNGTLSLVQLHELVDARISGRLQEMAPGDPVLIDELTGQALREVHLSNPLAFSPGTSRKGPTFYQ